MKRGDPRRVRVEQIMLAVGVHGPAAIFDFLSDLRVLYRSEYTTFREIQAHIEAHGMSRDELWHILNIKDHAPDCACWTCVGTLHWQIIRYWAGKR